MENASTFNGNCFHFFEVDSKGQLVCKECGYLLPLVNLSEKNSRKWKLIQGRDIPL
jgi:hypothetical protein